MVHGGDNVVRDFVIDFGEFPVGSVLPALDNCALISFFLSFFFFFFGKLCNKVLAEIQF
jgi:hypothetical protein